MVKYKHKGKRSKTRHKMRKSVRQKGHPPVNVMLQEFNTGDMVHIAVNPSVHSGMPFRRFHGKTGTVEGKKGKCYIVGIKDMRAKKSIIVHPAHLKPQKTK